MIPLFVYGTLLSGEANYSVVASYVLSVRQGAVRGTLYDAGEYPALVLSGRDRDLVQGEWLIISEEGLKQTDLLEEYYGPGAERNDYERIWIRDAKREEREGWVYVWKDSRGCPAIPSGSWRRHRNPEGSGV